MSISTNNNSCKIGRVYGFPKTEAAGKGFNARDIDNVKGIIDKMVEQYKDRSRKDIQKWRKALQMADHPEKPKLNFYHDLIDDLMTDGHLQAQIQLRENSTLNTEFAVSSPDGTINEEATNLFRQEWFYEFIKEVIGQKLRGTKVAEFQSFAGNKVSFGIIPQRNVVPRLKAVYTDLTKDDVIFYNDPFYENWIIQIGKDRELGILNNIVPNLIWKRNVMQAWAEFCERFGLPMVSATTNKYDTETINKIDYMLSQLAQASRGVFPQGTSVEFKEANRTDAYQTFDKFCERNNREISEPIVGGTMLTDDGSSRSQSEVHERNLDDKIAVADKRSIVFLVNDCLIPLLVNQGYSFFKEGDRFDFLKSHNLELDKFWEITSGVMQEYEVDEDWLSNTFSIPIVGKKKSQQLTPKAENHLDIIGQIDGINFPNYPTTSCCDKHAIYAASSKFEMLMNKYHNELLRAIWDKSPTLSAQVRIIAHETAELVRGLFQGWSDRRLSIGYNAPDHLAMQLMEFNLIEFASSKTEARLASMSQLLIDKDALKIRSFADFKREAEKISTAFNKTYLETEYNLAVSTAQGTAQQIRFLEEKDTVTNLVKYQTVGDSKVRSEHQALDGLVFDLNDNETLDIWTPNGYGCRCEFIQHLDDGNTVISTASIAKKLLGEKFIGSAFDVNRGNTGQVFTKKQFYSSTKGLNKKLGSMRFDKVYGLESWTVFKQRLNTIKLDQSITGRNVSELFKADGKQGKNDFMGFTDYLKRKIILKKSVFNTNIKGKYLNASEQRHRIFPHLSTIIKSPDEVWIHSHSETKGTFGVRYIKFYKDKVILVETMLGDNNMEIVKWHVMKSKEAEIRKGLLIK
jgi:SPP1 gp7 family putative phage head morphogenesis protein